MVGSYESSQTTSEQPASYELSVSHPCFKGKSLESSYELGVQMWFAKFRVNQPCFRLEGQGQVQKVHGNVELSGSYLIAAMDCNYRLTVGGIYKQLQYRVGPFLVFGGAMTHPLKSSQNFDRTSAWGAVRGGPSPP